MASQRWAFLYLPVTQFGMLDDGEGDAVLLASVRGAEPWESRWLRVV